MNQRTIKVDELARVEGQGGVRIRMRGDVVEDVQVHIFEPPRFFEALLRGRSQLEAPDITSRICGICPVAYQTSAVQAVEDAVGIQVDGRVRALRRLLYCGEWIESHTLHAFLLHAPDFLGYPDGMAMARDHPDVVSRALRMKKAGNALMSVIGGREIHPINVRVGGFYRAPAPAELQALVPELAWGKETAQASLAWAAQLPFPELVRDWEFVSLREQGEYPITAGRVVSSGGLDIPVQELEQHVMEEQVPHSTALHARLRERGSYLCGPLARFNLSFDRLPADVQALARAAGLTVPVRNPFQSLLVRLVEVVFAFGEALRLIAHYAPPEPPAAVVPHRPGTGCGASEAPRGLLYHRYVVDGRGTILEARIIPPTSQNLRSMEQDLRALAPQLAQLPPAEAAHLAARAVRNHDPCISCATHTLDLRVERP